MKRQVEEIEANGLRFLVHLWGDRSRPLIVFVHGFFDSGISFAGLAERLQQYYFCVAPDLRGFGRSQHAPSPLGYHFYEHVADLYRVICHYGGDQPCTLVGHSMGGNLVFCLAGTFPEKVKNVLSIDGYGLPDAAPDALPLRLRRWVQNIEKGAPAPRYYADLTTLLARERRRFPRVNETLERLRYEHMTVRDATTGQIRLSADTRHRWGSPYQIHVADIAAFWRRIEARCVLVLAENSETKAWMERFEGRGAVAERLAHLPAHAEVVTLEDCGHLVHLERPDAVLDVLGRLLEAPEL